MKIRTILVLFVTLTLLLGCRSTHSENTTSTSDTTVLPTTPPNETILPKTPNPSVPMDKDCIDKSKIDAKRPCPDLYDPICGCNGKDYSNSCDAQKDGVQKWTEGNCK